MSKLDELLKDKDASSIEGNQQLCEDLKEIPETELYHAISFDVAGQSLQFKRKYSLAKMELDRRAFQEQKKLTRSTAIISALSGLLGVIIGAVLQAALK